MLPQCDLQLPHLLQLVLASRAAAGVAPAAWRAGWRRASVAYAVAAAASPAAGPLLSSVSLDGGLLARAQQWAWAAAAALVAAVGPAALLAALRPGNSETAGSVGAAAAKPAAGAAGSAARHCAVAVGLAGLVLQAAYCILTRWVQCCALLLAAVPLYSLAGVSLSQGGSGSSRLATVLIISLTAGLCYSLAGTAWLSSLLPHVLVIAAAAMSPS